MLQITVPAIELWDERTEQFIKRKEQTLQLEHSLVSISKWESRWHKPFLGKGDKTNEEILDYVKCMTITQNVDPDIYNYLTASNFEHIENYIDDPMTATTFSEEKSSKGSNKIVTSEVIYAWMIALQIPTKFEKWHLNRLLTQIRTCSAMNQPSKKKSKKELASQYAALNAANRKKFNSRG